MGYPVAVSNPEDDIDPPGAEGMDAEEFQAVVLSEIENAVSFIDSDIAPLREKATLYYRGALFGDEQEGRSQVISRDVHDVVNGVLPSLMRVFFGPEKVVEFVPDGEDDVEMAEQATDYANFIVQRDNPGFTIFWNAFKDALVRKVGFVKYYWDGSVTVSSVDYSGLDPMAVNKLLEDLSKAQEASVEDASQDENGFTVTIKLKKKADRLRIVSIPPEEYIIDSLARSPLEYTLKGHRTEITRSELIAMGYNEEDIEDLGHSGNEMLMNVERQAREITAVQGTGGESGDESQTRILYFEGFIRCDKDGDGIAELHKVCAAGSGWKVLKSEPVDDDNFAEFFADLEPHTFFGEAVAEKVMDIQKIKSGVTRASLDSLALSVFPRTAVTVGANIADVMNTEIGAVIRVKQNTDVTMLTTPFVGRDSFPMLAYMDEVRESRTGMSKTAMGLQPGDLQNMTALAAANQFNKSHEHIEIIARIIAETGMKRLFRGILREITQNQRQARVINLRNKWVSIDPRAWKANMDVTCNVALGAGTSREKLAVLEKVLAKQEQIFATVGPDNPLVSINEYHNTLTEMLALSGFKNGSKYFTDPAKWQPGPGSAKQPDPKLIDAQTHQQKVQLEAQKMQTEAALKQIMAANDSAHKNADRQQALQLGLAEISAKYQTTIEAATIKAQAEMMRISADLHMDAHSQEHRTADVGH